MSEALFLETLFGEQKADHRKTQGILRSRDNGSNADVSTLNLDHHSIAPGEHACERDEKRQKLSVMVMVSSLSCSKPLFCQYGL